MGLEFKAYQLCITEENDAATGGQTHPEGDLHDLNDPVVNEENWKWGVQIDT